MQLLSVQGSGSSTTKIYNKSPRVALTVGAKTDVTSPETKKKKMDRVDNKPNTRDSLVTSDDSITVPAESLTQVTSLLEQTPTEDTCITSTHSEDVSPNKAIEFFAETSGATGAIFIRHTYSVEKDPPKPLEHVLPPSVEACTVNKSLQSSKTITLYTEPDGDDICAAILLACLFCHPLDCLLATLSGCNECFWSLCSSLCSCKPSTLQPLQDVTQHGDFCGCLGICKRECQICDICLQATECLDLAMEISQMLYH